MKITLFLGNKQEDLAITFCSMLCGIFYSAIAEEERSRTQFALFSYMQSIQMK
jgi:hypothetical protein